VFCAKTKRKISVRFDGRVGADQVFRRYTHDGARLAIDHDWLADHGCAAEAALPVTVAKDSELRRSHRLALGRVEQSAHAGLQSEKSEEIPRRILNQDAFGAMIGGESDQAVCIGSHIRNR
jgi:hypothetical protein